MVYKQKTEEEYRKESLVRLSRSLMPIGLGTLIKLKKDELMIIILNRETAFNEVRRDYIEANKASNINSFKYSRINLSLTYTQEQLIETHLELLEEIKRLKRKYYER